MLLKSFNDEKATQAAVEFIKLSGGKMKFIRLIKLLYILDRTMLIERGCPVTWDWYTAMPRGPVLSNIYNLIKNDERAPDAPVWRKTFKVENNDIVMIKDPERRVLSKGILSYIKHIHEDNEKRSRWEIIERLHSELPEWEDPTPRGLKSIPIDIEEILAAGGKNQEDIDLIISDLKSQDRILASGI